MTRSRRLAAALALAVGCSAAGFAPLACKSKATTSASPTRAPDVPYEPSAPEVVDTMLRLAQVKAGDIVYDLGCGDGRIVIAAVQRHDARGVCIDIDPERIRESRANAERAGVADRIEFRTQDLFEAQIADASVVMLFLWPEINLRLLPKLKRELEPGTRVVSHWHDMGEWKPDQVVNVVAEGRAREVYLWTIR